MDKNQARKLFTKYINYNCTPEECQQLEAFFDSYQENEDWSELVFGSREAFKKDSWARVQSQINNKKKRYPFRPFLKYVAAASVLLLVALTIFLNKENDIHFVDPVITNTNIEPGTDKATLTLEDGSVVTLEKGASFQTQNANSNGEKLIYKSGKKPSKEIAYNYLTIPRGGQFFIKLEDGTQVWLNSESQLKYPVTFIDGKPRQVELVYGEAYFDVSPSTEHNGSKFKVLNQSQEVEVLGTEFNIKAYKDEINIYTTLVEGEVVVDNGALKQNLIPNQQLNLNSENKNTTITEVDVMTETSWKNGVFSFRNKSLKDIMKVISRWYDVDVVFVNKELELVKFNGNLNKNQSIERILSIMQSNTLNKYKIKNKTILLE